MDMGAANRNGLRHGLSLEQRKAIIAEAAEQRYVEYTGGKTKYTSGTVHELNENSTPIEREFYEFYRTPRGEVTPKGATKETTTHPTLSSNVKFMNFYPFNDIETISPRPMLFITGENAHSREFSEDAYAKAAEPKELLIIQKAVFFAVRALFLLNILQSSLRKISTRVFPLNIRSFYAGEKL